MTVTTTTASQTFQGNSVATAFPCGFEIILATDINVYFVNPTTGVQTLAVLDSDYTVTGAGASSGFTVNTTVAVPTGTNLYVVRALPLTQPTDFTNQGSFFPTLHESAFDRLCMLIQQVANYSEGLNITMPPGLVPQPSTLFPIPQAGSLIGWNAAGNALVNTGPTTGVGGISDINVATNAAIASTKINFNQPSTGQFFTQNGAVVNRFNDRIFLGAATVNDGAFPAATKDWLTNFYNANGYTLGYSMNGQLSVLSTTSSASAEMVVSGVQSLNFPNNGAYGTAFYGVGVNNGTAYTNMGVNAFYGEAHNTVSNLNSAYVCEFDTRTLCDPATPTPYQQGTIVGIQMGSGAGTSGVTFTGSISGTTLTVSAITYALPYGANPNSYQIGVGSILYGVGIPYGAVTVTALGTGTGGVGTYTISQSLTVASETMVATNQYDASCALQIEANPTKFKVGINFGATSITGCDGVNGAGTAIAFALGHQMNWYNSSGAVIGRIASYATTQANTGEIQFNDNGIEFRSFNTGGGAIAYFDGAPNAVNWLTFTNSATGTPTVIGANGTDANIDLQLSPKGTGAVRIGTYTVGAPTAAGYITVKDSTGTVRKLLCA